MVEEPVRRVISWNEYDELVSSIASQVKGTPDAIVGLTRGGLVPAVTLSHMYNANLYCLNISLRDGKCSSAGFDWKDISQVWKKLDEEISEVKFAQKENNFNKIEDSKFDISTVRKIIISVEKLIISKTDELE